MKKTIRVILSTLLLLTLSLLINGQITNAAADVGGSVSVKGKITFYEGDNPPHREPQPTKPMKPSLPQTSESRSSYHYLGISLLMLSGGYVLVIKRREGARK